MTEPMTDDLIARLKEMATQLVLSTDRGTCSEAAAALEATASRPPQQIPHVRGLVTRWCADSDKSVRECGLDLEAAVSVDCEPTAASLREPPQELEPHVQALMRRAERWMQNLWDDEVGGDILTKREEQAEEIIRSLMVCVMPLPSPPASAPAPHDKRECPYCHELCAHPWCGRCCRALDVAAAPAPKEEEA
jgi:hypothetical protein